jgi:hypothetical protein
VEFRLLVLPEFVFVATGKVADGTVPSLVCHSLTSLLLSLRSLFLVGLGLSGLELGSGIDALLFVVCPPIGEILGLDVVCDLLQLLFCEVDLSLEALFEGVVRASAIVGEKVDVPGAEVVEAVIMVAVKHGPEVTGKDCFEGEDENAVCRDFGCHRNWTCCQKDFPLDGVAILEGFLDVVRQSSLIVVFFKTSSNSSQKVCCRADVEFVSTIPLPKNDGVYSPDHVWTAFRWERQEPLYGRRRWSSQDSEEATAELDADEIAELRDTIQRRKDKAKTRVDPGDGIEGRPEQRAEHSEDFGRGRRHSKRILSLLSSPDGRRSREQKRLKYHRRQHASFHAESAFGYCRTVALQSCST